MNWKKILAVSLVLAIAFGSIVFILKSRSGSTNRKIQQKLETILTQFQHTEEISSVNSGTVTKNLSLKEFTQLAKMHTEIVYYRTGLTLGLGYIQLYLFLTNENVIVQYQASLYYDNVLGLWELWIEEL